MGYGTYFQATLGFCVKDNAESSEPEEAPNTSGAMRASRRRVLSCPNSPPNRPISGGNQLTPFQTNTQKSSNAQRTTASTSITAATIFSGGGPQPQAERAAAPRAGPGLPPSLYARNPLHLPLATVTVSPGD